MKKHHPSLWFFLILAGFAFLLSAGCEESDDNDNNIIPDTTQNGDTNLIPAGWKKVGDLNANDMIWSLASDGSGNIYAAGYFTNGQGYRYVAKWNGTSWSELGNLNANHWIFAITATQNGHVFAVGDFTNGATPSGGFPYVAHWDGSGWNDIGGGGGYSITADQNNNIYVRDSVWNGTSWSILCPACSLSMGTVYSIATNDEGTARYAGGTFSLQNGYRYIAGCDESNCWSPLGDLNANEDIQAIITDPSGNVYAGGRFTNGSLPTTGYHYVAKWNGTGWSELGNLNANGTIYSLAYDRVHNYVYASGYFTNSKGEYYVAKWDGTSWNDLGNMHLAPAPIMVDRNGKLYSVVVSSDGKKFNVVVHD